MTYTEDDLTPWFPPDVKPVRKGVYRTESSLGQPVYQNWNGVFWGYYCGSPERATHCDNASNKSSRQRTKWRGLNKQP